MTSSCGFSCSLWRPLLLVAFMHSHLNASDGYGCSRGAIFLNHGSTTSRGDSLWATMTLNKYSEHGTEAGANTVSYTSEDKKSVRERCIRAAAIVIVIPQGIWSIYYIAEMVKNHHSFPTLTNKSVQCLTALQF
jgi:hypothetical protein